MMAKHSAPFLKLQFWVLMQKMNIKPKLVGVNKKWLSTHILSDA